MAVSHIKDSVTMTTVTAAGPSCSRVMCPLKWHGQGEAARQGGPWMLGRRCHFCSGNVFITSDKEALFSVLCFVSVLICKIMQKKSLTSQLS